MIKKLGLEQFSDEEYFFFEKKKHIIENKINKSPTTKPV